ncbi:hypothetical protein GCM10010842_00990 [Deinococcus daejeonensis]|uniref:Uncharacterized protein n=1 Tax=Deinococcus daejeonensis TaxID=1007098 RepID=A0ABQ2ISI8_9DEIO|nr:hypothetical protein GCM10010842_00990 [Deinococcus daejeonensis]
MRPVKDNVKLVLPEDFDDAWLADITAREYFPEAIVSDVSGNRYRLFFITSLRLSQELKITIEKGIQNWFSEPGLVVVDEIDLNTIRRAINGLWEEGYFNSLLPIKQ